jgi:hypothetical protein
MKKAELKKILKPMIRECIKEVIFEDGTLSSIISEVMRGIGQPIVEQKQQFQPVPKPQYETEEQAKARLEEKKKKMMESIGGDAYNGVNLFEGTTPMSSQPTDDTRGSPLQGVDPKDPGVDISSVMSKSSAIWSKMKRKK